MQEQESIPASRPQDRADDLTAALLPTVEQAIRISVRRNPKPLVDAIFPVIGPATRKAIAEALRSMVQSLSRTLEHSLSIRGLKWRIQALATGRPFAEIVLLNTLVYRVEQMFLIHRETGLLLQHVQAEATGPQEPDMISGMLTAIRDFVQDSFGPARAGGLETIRMGDVNVMVEDGPHAILAGVVRGTVPEDLRAAFSGVQETVHDGFARELESFSGDTAPFERLRPLLESCLVHQERNGHSRVNPLLLIVPVVLLVAGGLLVGREIYRNVRWNDMVRDVSGTPGLLVIHDDREGAGGMIQGARDPEADGIDGVLRQHGYDPGLVRQEWVPVAVELPRFVLSRARRSLSPPAGVQVELTAHNVLKVSGAAPHGWIDRAMVVAGGLPGPLSVDLNGLIDADRLAAGRLAASVGKVVHSFEIGAATLNPGSRAAVTEVADMLEELSVLSRRAHQALHVDVVGRADPTGPDTRNRVLSQERASAVVEALVADGVPRRILSVEGAGTESLAAASPAGGAGLPHNRCVTYRITLESFCHD